MCVCFAPELVHVWIYNMEDTWVLPLSLLCALGDPHIVLFVIIHLVDFLCYVTSFFLWKTELYTWTCWMQHMRWEAIINKTIHLCLLFIYFFFTANNYLFNRSLCASVVGLTSSVLLSSIVCPCNNYPKESEGKWQTWTLTLTCNRRFSLSWLLIF